MVRLKMPHLVHIVINFNSESVTKVAKSALGKLFSDLVFGNISDEKLF